MVCLCRPCWCCHQQAHQAYFRAPLITPFCFPTWAFSQLLRLPAGKGRFPKYSFSDAKFRFWRLVSEKNTCVGIPKGINRGALKFVGDNTNKGTHQ